MNYLEKGTNKILKAAETRTEKTFGETYEETAPAITGYTIEGSGKQDVVLDAHGKQIIFFYTENEDVIVNYLSESLTKGTVTLDTESIAPATGAPKGSEAKPADGYVFTHWTNSNGDTVATGEDNKHYTPVKNAATEVFEAEL